MKNIKELTIEKSKEQRGITLITLVVTIILLLILTFTLTANFKPYDNETARVDFQSDIIILKESVEQYYSRNGTIPTKGKYTGEIQNPNVNDAGDYYIIDLSALGVELALERRFCYK